MSNISLEMMLKDIDNLKLNPKEKKGLISDLEKQFVEKEKRNKEHEHRMKNNESYRKSYNMLNDLMK